MLVRHTLSFGLATLLLKSSYLGKTTISVALAELFQFGHTQSDNFPGNKRGFLESVNMLLRSHDVVIADKLRLSRFVFHLGGVCPSKLT